MATLHYKCVEKIPEQYLNDCHAIALQSGFQNGLHWFNLISEYCGSDGIDDHIIISIGDAGKVSGFIALRQKKGQGLKANIVHGMTAPYSTEYCLSIDPAFPAEKVISELVQGMNKYIGTFDIVQLDCIPEESPQVEILINSFRQNAKLATSYCGFENWYEAMGDGFDAYWQRRPSKLKNTWSRKYKKAHKKYKVQVTIFPDGGDIDVLAQDYDKIYANSWKVAEADLAFIPNLIKQAAAQNVLRLGVLYFDNIAVAAQIWLVSDAKATIFKLAHDEHYASASPGTLLTVDMFKHVLEKDQVIEIDYGRGPDAYKRDWLGNCRHRRGIIAFSITLRGAIAALRHFGGVFVKGCLNWHQKNKIL